jgi:tRNA-binding protein
MNTTDFETFLKVEMRVGTVLRAEVFAAARQPAYILQIDFGEYGILKSSAQICELYQVEELIGKQLIAVINFPKKQIGNLMSQCLVLGLSTDKGISLLRSDHSVENGQRVH